MKKRIISIFIILILSIILFSIISQVQAVGIEILSNPDDYIQLNEENDGILPIAKIIVGVVRGVGTAISLLMLTIIGVRYITGSIQEKAEYKQTMWPYVLGAVLIFAGTTLVDIIYNTFIYIPK